MLSGRSSLGPTVADQDHEERAAVHSTLESLWELCTGHVSASIRVRSNVLAISDNRKATVHPHSHTSPAMGDHLARSDLHIAIAVLDVMVQVPADRPRGYEFLIDSF